MQLGRRRYGALEKQSLARALVARGFVPDPEPWGKRIDRIEVYNEDVFPESCDGAWWGLGCDMLKWSVNHIHYTTREFAIRDELTLDVGEVWDQARVEESGRRLRDPLYSSVIALIPVKSTTPGNVTLLVVTRDVFSLRLNTQYTAQEVLGKTRLTNLSVSLSENNFLGQRNLVAATMSMDEGAIAVGPQFIDKNLFGSHLTLSATVADILTRHSVAPMDPVGLEDAHKFHSEGSSSSVALALPLWSLASEWGAGATFSHNFGVARSFGGMSPLAPAGLRTYDDPATPGNDMLPLRVSEQGVVGDRQRRPPVGHEGQEPAGDRSDRDEPAPVAAIGFSGHGAAARRLRTRRVPSLGGDVDAVHRIRAVHAALSHAA